MEHSINFDSTYFIKLVRSGARYPYIGDWVECTISKDKDNYLKITTCDDNAEGVRMNLACFEQLIADGNIVENVDGKYHIATYDCYEPLCGNTYLHHSAHYLTP